MKKKKMMMMMMMEKDMVFSVIHILFVFCQIVVIKKMLTF